MRPAQEPSYLIRLDDVCPTMNWTVWKPLSAILMDLDIRPLIAVVPDNQDPHLRVDLPNPEFWEEVRRWQRAGWTIGLHGYQHSSITRHPGICGRAHKSEFAGLPAETQLDRLERGLAILRDRGICPRVWIAPGHSFDLETVRMLRQVGIRSISDGYAVRPYTDQHGMFWIPQQLTDVIPKKHGVWTVCLHPNSWTHDDLGHFARTLRANRFRIKTTDEILATYQGRKRDWSDYLQTVRYAARYRLRRTVRGPSDF